MGTTPINGWPFGDIDTDAPNGPEQLRQALLAIEASFGPDTGWLDLTLTGMGWAVPAGEVAQLRLAQNWVVGRGYIQHTTFTAGPTTVADLPTAIPAPSGSDLTLDCPGNTTQNRTWTVTKTGRHLQAFTTGATSSYYSLAGIRYRI